VTDEALLQLPKFPVLSSLILRGTLASNDGLKPLGGLDCLEHLDLGSKWEIDDAGGAQGWCSGGLSGVSQRGWWENTWQVEAAR
jgi:hypothetical protein